MDLAHVYSILIRKVLKWFCFSVLSPLPLPPGAHLRNLYVPYIKLSFAPSLPMLPQDGFHSHLLPTSPLWRGCIDLPVE